MKAAIRLLVSEDSFTPPTQETLLKLQQKHPPSSIGSHPVPIPGPDGASPLVTSEDAVRSAILSFPAGSAGGPDGLSPLHLKVMLGCKVGGPDLLAALTGFVNMTLAGRCSGEVARVFFGGRLMALDKKSGGVRPIAIGFSLRRITSMVANFFFHLSASTLFESKVIRCGGARWM